jgi:hypothetical protein
VLLVVKNGADFLASSISVSVTIRRNRIIAIICDQLIIRMGLRCAVGDMPVQKKVMLLGLNAEFQ